MAETAVARPPLPLPFLAGLFLLACFAAQCLYIASHARLSEEEIRYASPGPQFAGKDFVKPTDPYHSPLVYYIAQYPVRHGTVPWFDFIGPQYQYRWLLRLPFVIFGILRGISLWYVARRQIGQIAGLFALALYSFSPRIVAEGSHVWADGLAAWGFFGVVYLAIASAHTLYAAPRTLTWHERWRRPILMGIAFGIAIAAQFTTWIALPLAIAFLLYLVPGRRRQAASMLGSAAVIALLIFFGVYRFDGTAAWSDADRYLKAAATPAVALHFQQHHAALREIVHGASYGLFAITIAGLLLWLIWRRSRWFGNSAALIALVTVLFFTRASSPEQIYRSWSPATAFLFMFLAGVFADALDTRRRKLAVAIAIMLLLVDIGFGLAHTFTALS